MRSGTRYSTEPAEKVDLVLANPPFGKASSVTFIGEDGRVYEERREHHPDRLLGDNLEQAAQLPSAHPPMPRVNGVAAVVLPDNVLFEGGAGETIRRRLLQECNVHTLLRLPDWHLLRPGR